MISIDLATGVTTNNVYYFDSTGTMTTGWVRDSLNNYYFFETANNDNVGKMVTGWKQVGNDLYFFGFDGKMAVDTITPDGLYVGSDGKLSLIA